MRPSRQKPSQQGGLLLRPVDSLPRIVDYYRASQFLVLPERAAQLWSEYLNLLTTIFPIKRDDHLVFLSSTKRPKRIMPQPIATQLANAFIERYSAEYTSIMGQLFPQGYDTAILKRFTRTTSVPSDRQIQQLPGMTRIIVRLREVPFYLPEVAEQPPHGIEGEAQVTIELRGWMTNQYIGHVSRTTNLGARALIHSCFQSALDPSQFPQQLFHTEGVLMKNPTIQRQIKQSMRFSNQKYRRYYMGSQPGDDIQDDIKQLFYGAFFYFTMPITLFVMSQNIAFDDVRIRNIILRLKPVFKFYFDLDFVEQIPLTITVISIPFNLIKFWNLAKDIKKRPLQMRRRLYWDMWFKHYATLAQALINEQHRYMDDWSGWQNYGTKDENGQIKIDIKNYLINVNGMLPQVLLQVTGGDQQVFDATLETFRAVNVLVPGIYRLNWQFYAKKFQGFTNQFQQRYPDCIRQLNYDLTRLGYPIWVPGEDHIGSITTYCLQNSIGLHVLGFKQQMIYGNGLTIRVAPNHIEIQRSVKEVARVKKSIARFMSQAYMSRWHQIALDQYEFSRPLKQDWRIGKQLPFDTQSDTDTQITLRRNCIVIDIEATAVKGARQVPYLICAVGYIGSNTEILYRSWANHQISRFAWQYQEILATGMDISEESCIYLFVEWLKGIVHQYDKQDPLYIWGYNSMGYELAYLLQPLTKAFGKVQLTGHVTACKSFSLCQGAIVFADVLKILPPQRLSQACKDFNTAVQKGDLEIAKYLQFGLIETDFELIKQYCFYDCVSTLLLLHKAQGKFVGMAKKLKIPHTAAMIASKLTASSLGWFFYIQGFLKQSVTNNLNSKTGIVNEQPQEVYKYQRSSYTGGIVQVWKYVCEKAIYVVDVNSMYPYMLKRPQPWYYGGQATQSYAQLLKQPQSDMYLFQLKSYELPATFLGSFVCSKQGENKKNTYFNSYYKDEPLYIRGVTLRRVLYHKGVVNVSRAWRYSARGNKSLGQFAQYFYRERKASAIKAQSICNKLMMNSVIGRMSMSEKTPYEATTSPDNDDFQFLTEDFYLSMGETVLPPVGRLVRITAYVTECAKVYLDQLAQKAGYENILYMDTDSLIVTLRGYLNLGSPTDKAQELGQFKRETEKQSKYPFYLAGYFKNRKDYILMYEDKQGQICYLYKAKGIPRRHITKEFTEQMIRAFKLVQPDLVGAEFDEKFIIGDKVEMQVWKKSYKQKGVTPTAMLKRSSVIVDRFFKQQGVTGIPRTDKYYETS